MSVNLDNSIYQKGVSMSQVNSAISEATSQLAGGFSPKGPTSVSTLNGLSGQENGWLYTLTDSGTLTDGSLAVVAGDTVAWDSANSVWYKAMNYATAQYGTNNIHNLTEETSFRTGDSIVLDDGNGLKKMDKDTILAITAQNAVDSDVAAPASLNASTAVTFAQGRLSSTDGHELSEIEDPTRYHKAVRSNFISIKGMAVFGVVGTTTYSFNVYLYDQNKNYVSNLGRNALGTYVTHDGFVRVVIFTADATGDISPATLDFSKLFFQANVKSARECAENSVKLSIHTINSSKVYGCLDRQTSLHSNYMTKSLLCTEASGLPIYYYTLGNGAKKILIISGQHGPKSDPAEHAVTCCNLVDVLCNNKFSSGSFLEKLKREYTIVIVPILNPYGFDNFNNSFTGAGGRNNYNGVNLNRDWGDFTQIETQSARDFITSFNPDVVIDLHVTGNYDGEGDFGFLWGSISSTALANGINADISTKMKVDYNVNGIMGVAGTEGTLSLYIKDVLNKVGGSVELQWFIPNNFESIHDSQILSCDFSWLTNVLYYLLVSAGVETEYSYQITPTMPPSY